MVKISIEREAQKGDKKEKVFRHGNGMNYQTKINGKCLSVGKFLHGGYNLYHSMYDVSQIIAQLFQTCMQPSSCPSNKYLLENVYLLSSIAICQTPFNSDGYNCLTCVIFAQFLNVSYQTDANIHRIANCEYLYQYYREQQETIPVRRQNDKKYLILLRTCFNFRYKYNTLLGLYVCDSKWFL